MAGNNAVQILRGTTAKIAVSTDTLAPGQLLYNETKNYLTCGNIAGTTKVNAQPIACKELVGYQGDSSTISSSTIEQFSLRGNALGELILTATMFKKSGGSTYFTDGNIMQIEGTQTTIGGSAGLLLKGSKVVMGDSFTDVKYGVYRITELSSLDDLPEASGHFFLDMDSPPYGPAASRFKHVYQFIEPSLTSGYGYRIQVICQSESNIWVRKYSSNSDTWTTWSVFAAGLKSVNGNSLGGQNSIYAPTTSGTTGQILSANSGYGPSWKTPLYMHYININFSSYDLYFSVLNSFNSGFSIMGSLTGALYSSALGGKKIPCTGYYLSGGTTKKFAYAIVPKSQSLITLYYDGGTTDINSGVVSDTLLSII